MDGVWGVEAHNYDGWERVSTAFFDRGVYRAGSADYYTLGTYSIEGRALWIKAERHHRGLERLVLGDKKAYSKVLGSGKLKRNGHVIELTMKDPGAARFRLQIRYIRLGDL